MTLTAEQRAAIIEQFLSRLDDTMKDGKPMIITMIVGPVEADVLREALQSSNGRD